jgi:WhiB family transcriptional regulator, redox-sensing transcriptional regulator
MKPAHTSPGSAVIRPIVAPWSYIRPVNRAVLDWMMQPGRGEQLPTLETLLQRPEWHQDAACRDMVPARFVRSPGTDYGGLRALCERCPVRQECLETALADDSLVGLWGGTNDRERREMRRAVA